MFPAAPSLQPDQAAHLLGVVAQELWPRGRGVGSTQPLLGAVSPGCHKLLLCPLLHMGGRPCLVLDHHDHGWLPGDRKPVAYGCLLQAPQQKSDDQPLRLRRWWWWWWRRRRSSGASRDDTHTPYCQVTKCPSVRVLGVGSGRFCEAKHGTRVLCGARSRCRMCRVTYKENEDPIVRTPLSRGDEGKGGQSHTITQKRRCRTPGSPLRPPSRATPPPSYEPAPPAGPPWPPRPGARSCGRTPARSHGASRPQPP
mmetsp:Transcript_3728/g.11729  ORF Transcript_3728/g.11729 Transcript_3728/m.11729 type:complete len:254 (+) Transcript_3728:1387-2148(+)